MKSKIKDLPILKNSRAVKHSEVTVDDAVDDAVWEVSTVSLDFSSDLGEATGGMLSFFDKTLFGVSGEFETMIFKLNENGDRVNEDGEESNKSFGAWHYDTKEEAEKNHDIITRGIFGGQIQPNTDLDPVNVRLKLMKN